MTNAERRKLLNEYKLSDRKESLLDVFSNYRKMQDGEQRSILNVKYEGSDIL